MNIFVLGNPDLREDSLPIRIFPAIREYFPNFNFEYKDPNEEWSIPESKEIVVMDTVLGIDNVVLYNNLESFAPSSRITMHDFDALANLKLLQKLGKIKSVKIIGIPQALSEKKAIQQVAAIISANLFSKNALRSSYKDHTPE